MLNDTTPAQRMFMAAVAVLAGIFCIAIAPTLAMKTLKIALDQAMLRLIPYDSDFYPAVPILSASFSFWIILIFGVGAMSLMLAPALYRGRLWARAVMLGGYGFTAVGGMTMMIPWFVLVLAEYPQKGVPTHTLGGMPSVMPVLFLGLAFYYAMLLADKDTWKNKILKLIPFTYIGVVAGMVFMNAQHGARYFIHKPLDFVEAAGGMVSANPAPPPITSPLAHAITNLDHLDWITFAHTSDAMVYSPQTLTLLLGGYGLYLASILMVLAIPFMAVKKPVGWYIATSAAIATAAASFQGFFVRNSFEWGVGGAMSAALLVMLIVPLFRKMFVAEEN